jgi:hypothetical protein
LNLTLVEHYVRSTLVGIDVGSRELDSTLVEFDVGSTFVGFDGCGENETSLVFHAEWVAEWFWTEKIFSVLVENFNISIRLSTAERGFDGFGENETSLVFHAEWVAVGFWT